MLIYIEFISRRPGVDLGAFHSVVGGAQRGWAGEFGADRLLLNLGRTWRIGPEPEYLCIWYTPDDGLKRIDKWEQIFRSGEADPLEEQFRLGARIDRAGCYEPLFEPGEARNGEYYAEYLDIDPNASREDVRSFFSVRQARHRKVGLDLVLLVDRIGKLGPDPQYLAFWSLPNWAALEVICRDLDDVDNNPVHLVTSALYANFGDEIL